MPFLYALDPEVAGGWGAGTVITNRLRVEEGQDVWLEVSKLEYRFDGWMGDELLTFISTFIVTSTLAQAIVDAKLNGVRFEPVTISTSDQWDQFGGKVELPEFKRLVPEGSVTIHEDLKSVNWSGHDFCWGVRDNIKDLSQTVSIQATVPPYCLVVSDRCLDLLKQHTLKHCDVYALT